MVCEEKLRCICWCIKRWQLIYSQNEFVVFKICRFVFFETCFWYYLRCVPIFSLFSSDVDVQRFFGHMFEFWQLYSLNIFVACKLFLLYWVLWILCRILCPIVYFVSVLCILWIPLWAVYSQLSVLLSSSRWSETCVQRKRLDMPIQSVILLHDTARPHTAASSWEKLEKCH